MRVTILLIALVVANEIANRGYWHFAIALVLAALWEAVLRRLWEEFLQSRRGTAGPS